MLMLMPMTEQEEKTIVQPMPKDAALYNERRTEKKKRNINLSVVRHILHTCDSLLCHAWLVLCDNEKEKQERTQTIEKKKGTVSRTR